ncbi:hypothetical protein [Nocardioides aquiterrae]|uniref:DUF2489 domain-containing protein n=1 Tax=Nocardioides aquiterrae TaxID=203799 RepID=A0ABP4F3M8_9ACTN
MDSLVSVLATSGWDVLTSIGTFVGALATAAAVIAALLINRRDRRAADEALTQQLRAQRIAREREHHLDLLINLQQQVAQADRDGAAFELGESLLLALPDASALPATRRLFAPSREEFASLPQYEDVYMGVDPSANKWLMRQHAKGEVAGEIRRVAQS